MKEKKYLKPLLSCLLIYLLCFAFRGVEYFFIRTDQSIFGEAFIHKLSGIFILGIVLRHYSLKWSELGFLKQHVLKKIVYGLFLGAIVYIIAYAAELFLESLKGTLPSLTLYVTSYSLNGNHGNQTGSLFFMFCILGNIINVIMEEGVFRGLFLNILDSKYSFIMAALFSSLLFGLWHIAAPVRSFFDGEISLTGAVLSALMLVATTGLTGFKFCLLAKLSGSLWMPMADHFFNNTIINLLHVITATGADELQVLRITIAQTLSFIIVLIVYIKNKNNQTELYLP